MMWAFTLSRMGVYKLLAKSHSEDAEVYHPKDSALGFVILFAQLGYTSVLTIGLT